MATDRTMPTFASTSTEVSAGAAPFGLADFLRVLNERRNLVRNVAVGFVLLTLLVLFYLPTLYASSAVVMLDQRKNNVADQSSVLSALPTDASSVQNQIQLLSSRDLALRVIGKLKLYDDPEFNPALDKGGAPGIGDILRMLVPANGSPPSQTGLRHVDYERDAIVSGFLSHLDVSALGLSTSITVTFTSRDPAKAALIANTLADTYTEDQVETKVAAARKATQWLTDRIHQLAQQAQSAENAVEQYKTEHNLVESADGSSLVDQQLGALNAQLVAAQSDLAEKSATYDRVNALVRSGNAVDVSQIVSSPLIVQLRTQEADLVRQEADLSARYGPNHPKLIAIRKQKSDLENNASTEAARIAGSIANDVAVARAHVGSIVASLARAEKLATGDNMARVKLNALQANVDSTRSMYESFVTRLRATQDQDEIQNPESQVISRAPIPVAPSSPHRLLIFIASLPAGILLGVLAALLVERFQVPSPARDIRVPMRQQRPALVLPRILAELPATADMRAADWPVDRPEASYSRTLSALVEQLAPDRPGRAKIVALTSPGADPGKSVIALGLARAAARRGLRTILVDGEFSRPVITTAMGYRPVTAGIVELLSGAAPLSRVLLRDSRSSVLVLSASRPVAAAQALWSSPKMAELLNYFRQTCDLVIVDAAPALAAAEMAFLAPLCDEIVLVTQGRAPQPVLEGAVQALAASKARMAGLVVTR